MTELEIGILDELNEIIDKERAAILRGDIEEVGEILEEKSTYLTALRELDDTGSQALHDVRKKVERNQSLLEQSMRGLKTVSDRLAEMNKVSTTLEVYDRSGNRKMFNIGKGSRVERRA